MDILFPVFGGVGGGGNGAILENSSGRLPCDKRKLSS